MKKNIKALSTFLLTCIAGSAFGQIKEEKLILDRKREPEVRRIEKKLTQAPMEKNYPPEEKSKTPVDYEITDIPAASDFRASVLQGVDIAPEFAPDHKRNYFRIDIGNYGKVLADGNISANINEATEIGGDIHFLSTAGLKKDYPYKSDQNSGTAAVFLNSYTEKGKFNLNADYSINNYNYYGIYALEAKPDTDLKQKTSKFGVSGYYDFNDGILNNISVKSFFLSDRYDAKETAAAANANLSKNGIEVPALGGISLDADLGVEFEVLKSEFSLVNQNSSNMVNLNLSPKLKFIRENSYLMLGSVFDFVNEDYSSRNSSTGQKSRFIWFPKAEAQFAAADEFKFFAGVDGGLKTNSYAGMLEKLPFLLSDQQVRPTETKFHIYFGMRGDISQNFKYDFSAGYGKLKNILFFRANDLFDKNISNSREPYDLANTFSAAYADGKVSEVKGSVQYFPVQNLSVGAGFLFQKYDADNYRDLFNIPLLAGTLTAKYSMLQKKLHLGASAIFSSDRTTNSFHVTKTATMPAVYTTLEGADDKVGGYADLNLTAEYEIHKNFSIFALGNNLLNTRYQTFKGYRVLGAQIMGGVKISF